MLAVPRKNGRKCHRHGMMENTDDEQEDEQDQVFAEDELVLFSGNWQPV
jgi:hypothetical protein